MSVIYTNVYNYYYCGYVNFKRKTAKSFAFVVDEWTVYVFSHNSIMDSVCFICRKSDQNELEYGEFLTKGKLSVHYFCLVRLGQAENDVCIFGWRFLYTGISFVRSCFPMIFSRIAKPSKAVFDDSRFATSVSFTRKPDHA